MPIPARIPAPPIIPPPVLPPPPGSTGQRPPDEEFTLTLRRADGLTQLISGGSREAYMVRPGVQGLDMPPMAIYADDLPFDDGSAERGFRFADRNLFLPIRVRGSSYSAMRAAKLALYDLLDPKAGLVDVIVTQPDATARQATGRYAGGAEGDYGVDQFGLEWQVIGVTIRCYDPYFYAASPLVLDFAVASAAKPFLSTTSPFFPVQLGSSQVIGGPVTVNNPGDAEAFPVWRFTGPANDVTVTHLDTGRSFVLTAPIPLGGYFDVDTRPGSISIRDQNGANRWSVLSITQDDLFPLARGNNRVLIVMTAATAASKATLTVRPRYRAA